MRRSLDAQELDQDGLDRALLEAHERHDLEALTTLYAEAADRSETEADIDAACFYLTQAFVFALESGSSQAKMLNARLVSYGRAVRLPD